MPQASHRGIERLLQRFAADMGVNHARLSLVEDGSLSSKMLSSNGPAVSDLTLDELARRVVERSGAVMVDDFEGDALVVEADSLDRAAGSALALPVSGEMGELLGVLLAYSTEPRSWSNRDLERSDDIAVVLAAFLIVDRLRSHAEHRLAIETQARRTRQRMHSIAKQSASAASVEEIAEILVETVPALLGATWAVVAVQEVDGQRPQHWASPQLPSSLIRDAFAAKGRGGSSFLDEPAHWPGDPESIDRSELNAWPSLVAMMETSDVTSLAIIPLASDANSLRAALLVGSDSPAGGFRADMIFDELMSDAAGALARVAEAQQNARTASTLSRSLLPPRIPQLDSFEIGQLYNSAADYTRVGGDWYDIVQITPTTTAFVVGDVAGHDVRSAAVMGQLRHVLASKLRDNPSPAVALEATDRYFADLDENVMATAVVIVADSETRRADVALAGHPPPVVFGTDGPHLLIAKPGPPLGFGFAGYTESGIALRPGTVIIAYTDGVVERRTGDMGQHLSDFVGAMGSVDRSVASLVQFLDERSKVSQLVDDVAALVVQYVGD